MAKKRNRNNSVPGESDSNSTLRQSDVSPENSTIKKPKKFKIVYKKNQTKELYVGREKLVFGPHGEHTVDEKFRNHEHFKTQEKYFNVMEVK